MYIISFNHHSSKKYYSHCIGQEPRLNIACIVNYHTVLSCLTTGHSLERYSMRCLIGLLNARTNKLFTVFFVVSITNSCWFKKATVQHLMQGTLIMLCDYAMLFEVFKVVSCLHFCPFWIKWGTNLQSDLIKSNINQAPKWRIQFRFLIVQIFWCLNCFSVE